MYALRILELKAGLVRVTMLKGGEIFSQVDRLRELRLDVPPMTRLAHLLQERGIPISSGVLTVDDMVEEVKRLCPSCLSS